MAGLAAGASSRGWPADTSRRLRAIATRVGLRPEQVLAQLADQAVMGEDDTVTVPLFIPSG